MARRAAPICPASTALLGWWPTVFRSPSAGTLLALVADHVVQARIVFPGAGYLEMARAAAAEATLQGVFFLQPLAIDSATLLIECAVSDGRFEVRSGVDDAALADAAAHCSGSIGVGSWQRVDHASVRARSSAHAAQVSALYASFDAGGLQYGPAYRTIVQAWAGDGDAQARLRARVASEGTAVHPADLDDALCVGALIGRSNRGEANVQTRLPYALDDVLLQEAASGELWAVRRRAFPACPRWFHSTVLTRVCMCAQGASQQGGESISVRLGALASPPQAQLDGFKSRVLRAEAPAQRHLYATEWWALELREAVTTAAVLVLGDECLAMGDQPRASPVGCKELAGSADTAVGAVVLQAVATRGASCAHLPLCALEAALALVQMQATSNTAPTAWLVTEGAHRGARLPEHAGPWGLARSARVEASPLLVCIDAAPASALACGSPLTEPEVVLDRAGCSAARLVSAPPSSSGLMRLHFHARGAISNLFIEPQPDMEPPADDEVLLRVRGVGLNFRDVLNVLGEYPGNPGPPGGDTAGTISEASASAPDSVGSAVLGVAHAPLASVARAAALLLARKPTTLGFEQACTLPVTWSTTHVAVERAALRSDQTLIVHAAAGGVGLKAVEYGQWLRVPCIGSAGRPHKHVQLRAVGVEDLCSSRDGSAFAAGARLLSGGRAHEVLNSLSLDFIAASFTLLAESGSFEEIGKRDVWASSRHAASAPSTSYCAIALDTNMTHDPAWMHSVLSLLGAHCCVGVVASLPLRSFDMEAQYELAFRTLQSGLSMGKVVIRIAARTATGSAGAHLVTGGTGGLGLLTGRWLAQRGACDLVLASRSGALAHDAAAEWAVVQASDAAASLQRCDTGEEAHVRRLVAYAPPLTGVWHAAGVLADATLSQQKALSLARAYAPKAAGAWSLHAMTVASGVSAFALFSSVAALLGGAAQANYAAANACLDALSTCLCVHGSAATSVQWGAWAEVGMAARGAAGKRLAAMEAASGFGRIGLAQGLAALEEATRAGGRSVLGVVPVVWSRFLGGGVAAPAFLAACAPRTTEKTAVLGSTAPEGGSVVSLEAVLETGAADGGWHRGCGRAADGGGGRLSRCSRAAQPASGRSGRGIAVEHAGV